jgi:hypothetical protein
LNIWVIQIIAKYDVIFGEIGTIIYDKPANAELISKRLIMVNIVKKVFGRAPIVWGGMLFFAFGQPAMLMASTQQGYIPPASRSRPQRTQGAGSRGCPQVQPIALQLLIPSDRTARTSVSHPTLAWHLSAVPSTPLQLAVTEEGAAKPIFVRNLAVDRPGVMRYALPSELTGLQTGKEYRWTVSLICNPEHPSQNAYARGWIERVSTDADLVKRLNASASSSQKALVYAQAGIWYDAIATLLDTPASSNDRANAAEFLQALLSQVGLKEASTIKLI